MMGSVDVVMEEGEDVGVLSDFDEDEEFDVVLVELFLIFVLVGVVLMLEEEGRIVKEFVVEFEVEWKVWKVLEIVKVDGDVNFV